ncbi:MAG: hypothetical protein ACYCWE_09790 [Eubacteriales bacterium]
MPKKLSREYVQNKTIKELADEYNTDMKAAFGTDKVRITDLMPFLGCKSRDTVYRRVKGVPRYGGTNLYRTIDLARHFAEAEVRRVNGDRTN